MKISIIMEALTGTFETDIKRASKETEKAAKKMKKEFEDAGKAVGLAFAAAATAVAALIKSSINNADQLAMMSQKVGVSVEVLSALKYQAKLAGIEVEGLQTSMIKFSKTVAGAAAGGSQAKAFEAMGISIKDVNGNLKPTEQLLAETADAFASYEDGIEKTALATELFGKAGAEMIVMLNEGSAGMKAAAKEAKELAQIIGSDTAAQADRFNDNLDKAAMLATGFGNILAAKLLPSLVGVTDEFIEGQKKSQEFGQAAEGLANVIITLTRAGIIIKNVLDGLGITIVALGKSAWAAGVLMTDMMVAPALAAAAFATDGMAGVQKVVGVVAGHARDAKETWSEAWDAFKSGWSDAGTDIMNGIAALDQPMKALTENADETKKKLRAPIVGAGDAAIAAAKEADKLMQSVSDGQMKLADMAKGFIEYTDPIAAAWADFEDQIISVGRAADEQRAKIEEARSGGGNEAELAEAEIALQASVRDAIDATAAARDRNLEVIAAGLDVTGLYLADLHEEARVIGMSSDQQRIEATVLRALAEAKKINSAAGKDLVKVDEARIRQQAKINNALAMAAQVNQKSPFFEMIDQAETMADAIQAAIEAGFNPEQLKPMRDALGQMNAQIQVGTIESFKGVLSVMQTFTKEGSTGFKVMEKGLAALQIIQDVIALKAAVNAVLTQGQGEPYSAWARMAAMAAAVAPILASIGVSMAAFGGGSGGPSASSAEVRQASQGTGSVLGDANAKSESIADSLEIAADAATEMVGLQRGMLNSLQSLERALGAAGGMLARGAGNVDFPDAGGGGLFLGLWGESNEIVDQGIVIAGGALQSMLESVVVGAYQTVESNGGFFGNDSTYDNVVDVTDEFGRTFQMILGSIADTVREGATTIGVLPAEIEAALAAYRLEEIRVSLEGLSAEDQQAELAAVFSEIFDGVAEAVVPFIAQFQQVGEGLGETLVRVATGVQVTREAISQLGFALDETDPERFAQFSEALIESVGGLDAMINGLKTFVATFAPAAHQLEVSATALGTAFGEVGLKVPMTEDAMWSLMQTLDATTEEGREQIATLIRLSGATASYYDLLEKVESSKLEYLMKAAELQAELGQGVGFVALRAEIESWVLSTSRSLNDLARAGGAAGAAEQDLVNVHQVAAQRLAQLIQRMKSELRDLAVTLGYTTQADTIESLNSQIESLGSASMDAADAVGSAVDEMRSKLGLLLGDLSPLNDQRKLELALQGLREGSVDPETVLEIGRRLYASTSRYTDLFEQVMGMARFGGGGAVDQGSGGSAESRTLAELIAARDALLAAARPELADDLAHRIAEIAFASGEDFAAIAAEQGFALADIGADLGLNAEELNAYLEELQARIASQDFATAAAGIEASVVTSADRIVAAITGQPIEAVIQASDNRLAEVSADQKAGRLESDRANQDAINGMTSSVIAAGSADTARLVESVEGLRRELREASLISMGGSSRGFHNPPVQVR